MLPEQLACQLPEDLAAPPDQAGGWPSLDPPLGGLALDMPAAAAAAGDAALIGSACSAAGCYTDSLAAAVEEDEAAQQQQQQRAFTASPFLLSGPCSAGIGSLAGPGSPLAAAAAFHGMRSSDSSSASLCETAALQHGGYSSSLAKSCSMPIRLPGFKPDSRPDAIRLSGPSSLSCFSGPDASSLTRSGSASLSGLPGAFGSSMPVSLSCDSLSTMHGGSGAATPDYDPAAAAAA
ncbi:hypothetical protein COO60DRAFT_1501163, partial [Scenedesmus sp. NREL 46B-D3]